MVILTKRSLELLQQLRRNRQDSGINDPRVDHLLGSAITQFKRKKYNEIILTDQQWEILEMAERHDDILKNKELSSDE